MSTRIRLCAVGVLLVLASGCGGGSDGPSEPEPQVQARGSITGSVLNGMSAVAGASVSLSGPASRTASTTSAGAFTFADLAPGTYTVTVTVPSGLVLAAGENASRSVTVTANQASSVSFRLEPVPVVAAGTVSGTVRNGTAGVSGATLTLSAAGTSRTTTSAATGAYSFTNVAAGAYTVSIAVPAGFTLGAAEQGTKAVTVTAGATATADFALAAATGGSVVTIDIQGLAFTPRDVTVARGTRVRWTNNSGMFHTVTPDGHTQWSSADLNHGGTFEVVLNATGTFNYYCSPHRGDGMTGTIRVQ